MGVQTRPLLSGKQNEANKLTRVVLKWNAYKFACVRKRYNQVQLLRQSRYYFSQASQPKFLFTVKYSQACDCDVSVDA